MKVRSQPYSMGNVCWFSNSLNESRRLALPASNGLIATNPFALEDKPCWPSPITKARSRTCKMPQIKYQRCPGDLIFFFFFWGVRVWGWGVVKFILCSNFGIITSPTSRSDVTGFSSSQLTASAKTTSHHAYPKSTKLNLFTTNSKTLTPLDGMPWWHETMKHTQSKEHINSSQ